MNKKLLTMALILGCFLLETGCGKKDDTSVPAPAPAPVSPVAPNPYGYNNTYNSTCPVQGGAVPFHSDNSPIYGGLQLIQFVLNGMAYSSQGSNATSLNLSMNYVQPPQLNIPEQNMVGSVAFIFPDLQMLQGNTNTTYNANTSYCAYTNPNNPGVFNVRDGSLRMVLTGPVTYQYNTANPYNGQQILQTAQDTVTVSIGYNCPAGLVGNRIVGCVTASVGQTNNGPTWYYQAH